MKEDEINKHYPEKIWDANERQKQEDSRKQKKVETPQDALLEYKAIVDGKREKLSQNVLVFSSLGSVERDTQNNLLIVNYGEWRIAYDREKADGSSIPKEIPKDAKAKIIELMEQGIEELNKREREEK
jgi:hypothetical protein